MQAREAPFMALASSVRRRTNPCRRAARAASRLLLLHARASSVSALLTLLLLQLGLIGGWASPTLARLSSENSSNQLSPEQMSWIASLSNFSRFFGAILGPIATNYLGSKSSLMVTALPISVGWLIITLTKAVEGFYVARFSGGIGLGMALSTFPLFVGEVSIPKMRGALVALAIIGAPFGQVLASLCGSYLTVSAASSIYFILTLPLIWLFYWLPESPHHLIKMSKFEDARKAISWYRSSREIEEEFNAVRKFVAFNTTKNLRKKLKEFKNPAIMKATFITIAIFTFTDLCGLNIIMFFMESILKSAKFDAMDPSLIVIYVNLSCIFAAITSMLLIDRCGRRFILIISSIGTGMSMLGLMSHFLLLDLRHLNLQWLPALSMFLFMMAFFVGLFPVASTVLSEIFPSNIKCIAASIAILISAAMSFLSAKSYQPLVDLIGEAYVFLIYSFISIITIIFALFVMPETKNKSLHEIQDELVK